MNVQFRWVLGLAGLLLVGHVPAADRPNIVVFMVDDYDKSESSVYGGKVLTPNLERLAREGITFNNAHVTSTVCTPSRYTFLTGRYAGSSYYPEYLELFPPGQQALPGFNVGLEGDKMNVGALLAQNSYATGFVGKFHVGPSLSDPAFRAKYGLHDVRKNAPFTKILNRQQFENEKGFRKAVQDYGFTWAKNIYWENTKAPFQSHNPEWTIEAAVDFIEEHHDKPFYLHYCTTLLHGPNGAWYKSLSQPEVTGEGLIPNGIEGVSTRASVMERLEKAGLSSSEAGYLWMDDSLGFLLDKLDDLELSDNTVVLFVADHGSGNKGSLYKSKGTEVPCIMRWPRGMKAGIRSDELIQNTDFVPTWFDLASVALPAKYRVDGISLMPLFKKPKVPVRDYVYAEIGAARSVKTKDYSYITLRYTAEQVRGVRDKSRGFIKSMTGLSGGVSRSIASHPDAYSADQLYDLREDPDALENLASQQRHASTLGVMRKLLEQELRRFPGRPYGEFVPTRTWTGEASYPDVFHALRQAAAAKKKKK